jgi:carbamoyltransferase
MNLPGHQAFYHDSAAVWCGMRGCGGGPEERLYRLQHDHNFPTRPLNSSCAKAASPSIGAWSLLRQAFLIRASPAHLSDVAPLGLPSFLMAMPLWLKQKLLIPKVLQRELDYHGPQLYPEHHESHAASAFLPSPFERAAFITFDGVGEWTTMSWGTAAGNRLKIHAVESATAQFGLHIPLYYFLGFRVNSGEYKVMVCPYASRVTPI